MLDYHTGSKVVLASPKLHEESKRLVQAIPWHFAWNNQGPILSLCAQYCPAPWTCLTILFPESLSWEQKKEEEGECVTSAE